MNLPMYVRVHCDTCNEVSIPLPDLHVRFCLDNCDTSYWFLCPLCKTRVFGEVHETKRVTLLAHPGISPEVWFLPEEMQEAHEGPPLTSDDLLDFHQALNK